MQKDTILMLVSGRFRGAFARIARARARPTPGCFPGSAGGRRRRDAAGPRPEPGSSARARPGPRRSQPDARRRMCHGHGHGRSSDAHAGRNEHHVLHTRPPPPPPHRTMHMHARPPNKRTATHTAQRPHINKRSQRSPGQPLHSCGQTPSRHAAPASQQQNLAGVRSRLCCVCWRAACAPRAVRLRSYAVGARDVHESVTHAPIRPSSLAALGPRKRVHKVRHKTHKMYD